MENSKERKTFGSVGDNAFVGTAPPNNEATGPENRNIESANIRMENPDDGNFIQVSTPSSDDRIVVRLNDEELIEQNSTSTLTEPRAIWNVEVNQNLTELVDERSSGALREAINSHQRSGNQVLQAAPEPLAEPRDSNESVAAEVQENVGRSDVALDNQSVVINTTQTFSGGSGLISVKEQRIQPALDIVTPPNAFQVDPKASDSGDGETKSSENDNVKKDTERPNEPETSCVAARPVNAIPPPGHRAHNLTQGDENGALQVTKTVPNIVETTSQQTRRQDECARPDPQPVRSTSDKNVRGTSDKDGQPEKHTKDGSSSHKKEQPIKGSPASLGLSGGTFSAGGIFDEVVDKTKAEQQKGQPKKRTGKDPISDKAEQPKKPRHLPAGLSGGTSEKTVQSKRTKADLQPVGNISGKNAGKTDGQQPNGQPKKRAGAGAQLAIGGTSDKERRPGKRTGNSPVFDKAEHPRKRALAGVPGGTENNGPLKKHTRVGLRPAGRSSGKTWQTKKRAGVDPGLAKGITGKEPRQAHYKRDSNPSDSSTDGDHRPLPGSNSSPNQERGTDNPESMETDTDGSKETHPDCVKDKDDGGELEETITGFESVENPTELGAEREPQPCIDDIVTDEDIDEFCLTCGDPVGHDHVCVENVTERIIDDRRTF